MSKQQTSLARFIFSLILSTCLFALAGCGRSSSNVATTAPSPTALASSAASAESAMTPTATLSASPTPGEIKTSPSGFQYQDLQIGSGPRPLMLQSVKVAYVGRFLDGGKFDSGLADFKLGGGEFIKGWDWGIAGNAKEGIEPMRVGGKRKLIIPPGLGYGDKPAISIPPNSTLVFEVELLRINSGGF